VTERHNIVLILDEVQAGFGRSGKMFAFEHAGIEPDVVVMSKAVGGCLPLAVLGIKRKFDAWQPAGHTGTFRGNQLAMGTGLVVLDTIKNDKLAQNAHERGEFLQAELKKLAQEFPCIGNVRGRGLMVGVEIVDERKPADHMGSLPADAQLAAAIQTGLVLVSDRCLSVFAMLAFRGWVESSAICCAVATRSLVWALRLA